MAGPSLKVRCLKVSHANHRRDGLKVLISGFCSFRLRTIPPIGARVKQIRPRGPMGWAVTDHNIRRATARKEDFALLSSSHVAVGVRRVPDLTGCCAAAPVNTFHSSLSFPVTSLVVVFFFSSIFFCCCMERWLSAVLAEPPSVSPPRGPGPVPGTRSHDGCTLCSHANNLGRIHETLPDAAYAAESNVDAMRLSCWGLRSSGGICCYGRD